MTRGLRRLLAAIAVAAPMLIAASPALAAAQRFAAPGGSGTACTSASPCSIETAFSLQNSGDEIILAPGDYAVGSSLGINGDVFVHGDPSQPAPRLHMGAHFFTVAGAGSRLSHVAIDATSTEALDVAENTSADGVYAHSTAENACLVYGLLTNSVCWTSSPNDIAVNGAASGNFTPVLRNVTALATGSGGIGIEYDAESGGHLTVSAVNVIARGDTTDVETEAMLPSTAILNIDHSNFASGGGIGSGADVTATAKQSAAPIFVNAGAGDFREAAGSPTIDAGVNSPSNGSTDFEGNPRTINGVTDIGADEYDPFAGVSIGTTKAKVKKRKATVELSCPTAAAPPACEGTLTLTFTQGGKTLTAASSVFSMPIGGSEPLPIKLSKKAAKVLAKRGKLATTATAAATDGARLSKTTSAPLKLKLKRKRHR